jgi:hypothetical protein
MAASLLVTRTGALGRLGGTPSARGLVTAVEAQELGRAQAITVLTADGRSLRFRVTESVEMTPGHLREHMLFGEPVTVSYRDDGQSLVALQIDD